MSIFKSDCLEMFTSIVHFIGLLGTLKLLFNNELVMAHTLSSIQLTKFFKLQKMNKFLKLLKLFKILDLLIVLTGMEVVNMIRDSELC